MKIIAQTARLTLRELTVDDAAFINRLLNAPKFLQFIGDRGVRSDEEAVAFIEDRFRRSYSENGYGLWAVDVNESFPVGICGFVRRESLPLPDLGFAFLPEFERLGYGTESARAALQYGRSELGFSHILAITSLDNEASGGLLEKLGFHYDTETESPEGEKLKLYKFSF